jgi:TolA-binding protein
MVRKFVITFAMLALCAAAVPAQKAEQKESGFSSWLRDLQKKIDAIAPRKSLPVSTGVAGVRGAKDGNSKDKLYWKGKKGEEPVTEAELAEFREALAFAEKGDAAAAVKELEEFMKQYPDSALIPDAKKGLDMLKMEAKASPSEATQK